MVHRDVRILDQGCRIPTIVGVDADTDAHANMTLLAFDAVRQCDCREHLLRRQRHVFCLLNIGKHQHEFIPSPAADGVRLAHAPHQALRHRLQQLVAGQMPQRIVDLLELIQVHEHQRKLLALTVCQCNGLNKPVFQQAAVRQTGEKIVMGQMVQRSFRRLKLFGQAVCFNGRDDQVCVRLL